MSLTHSRIEYVLNPDGSPGYSWPVVTGCNQPLSICATRETCWARSLHRRFVNTGWINEGGWARLYNIDFNLRFNEHLLDAPFSLRKPSTIAVAFTGDLFGPGVDFEWQRDVVDVARVAKRHAFIFLTKSPERLAQHNPWPPNALVGCTITGAETPERQQKMMADLCNVEGGKRWVSYEPMLGPFLMPAFLINLDWLVIGKQSGKGAVKPKLEMVLDIIEVADQAGIKLWIKDNLLDIYPHFPRQERPNVG